MQKNWFRKTGPLYLPASAAGWALSLLTAFIAVQTFLMVDSHSHSASDTLIGAGPIIATLALLLWLLAAHSSGQDAR
ncbi:MAG TPA: hypothetical protein VMU01_04670 [Rhizomicrobium sp.]|nr:hypothetical protein [Rhizomicrobium sp.]